MRGGPVDLYHHTINRTDIQPVWSTLEIEDLLDGLRLVFVRRLVRVVQTATRFPQLVPLPVFDRERAIRECDREVEEVER